MAKVQVQLELTEEELKTIDEIAANLETDRAGALRDMVEFYLADYEQEGSELAEALRQVDAGETISHEEMLERFEGMKQRSSRSAAA